MPLKIAMLVHNDIVSDARIRKEAKSLSKYGYQVDLYGIGKKIEYPNEIEGCQLNIFKIDQSKLFSSNFFINLINKLIRFAKIKKFLSLFNSHSYIFFIHQKMLANLLINNFNLFNYDIIHAHDLIALIAANELKKKKRSLKIIWDAHELYTELKYKTKSINKTVKKIIESFSKNIDRMITINESCFNYYKDNFPNLPPSVILKNASRKNKINNLDKNLLRDFIGISKNQFILLYHGGFSPNRGIEILLDVANHMPDNWSIVFMGSGPLGQKINQKISDLKNKRPKEFASIMYIPSVPYEELHLWTAGADLGIIPYENTNLNHLFCTPNKIWEYALSGTPILATNLVEISKIINEYEIGILMPREFKASDIVNILKKLNTTKLKNLSENCSKFSKIENWQKYEKRLINMYKEIMYEGN